MAATGRELARKGLHVAMGGFAFALAYLSWWQAAILATVALLHNLVLLPRYGSRAVFRDGAIARGIDWGIVFYPATVLLLILLFRERLEIAAAAWAWLAFGDGIATVAGILLGRVTGPLPWNREKSWAGLLGFLLAGVPAGIVLWCWTRGEACPPDALVPLLVVGVAVAILESLPLGIDDNLVVGLAGGGLLAVALAVDPARLAPPVATLATAVGVNLLVGLAARLAGAVDGPGLVHGAMLGSALWCWGGPGAFVLLLLFFVLGTGATRIGWRTKEREGTAQEKGGRRGAKHAWANAGAPVLFALLAAGTGDPAPWVLALAAALATATADTLGSEIGQAFGRRTFLVTTFRPVPRGTDGAVSLEGTLAGIAGSAVIGLAALGLDRVGWLGSRGLLGWTDVAAVVVAAFAGTTLESVLGATLERARAIDNEAQNFLNTLVGGLVAVLLRRGLG